MKLRLYRTEGQYKQECRALSGVIGIRDEQITRLRSDYADAVRRLSDAESQLRQLKAEADRQQSQPPIRLVEVELANGQRLSLPCTHW